MNSYPGANHVVFYNNLVNGVESAISREHHYHEVHDTELNRKLLDKFQKNAEPALRGSALVTIIASVEHLIGKNSDRSWELPNGWYGRKELKHLRFIRHCWAHAAGFVLDDLRADLTSFKDDLDSGLYADHNGKILGSYISLDNDFVTLQSSGLQRVRALSIDLLKAKNLVAP